VCAQRRVPSLRLCTLLRSFYRTLASQSPEAAIQSESLPQGMSFKSLEAATRENEELFRRFFMAQPVELGSHKYAALHKARLSPGAFLYIPRNVEVALPVEIFHWVEGENLPSFRIPWLSAAKTARSPSSIISRVPMASAPLPAA
jgi:Fe-S cluster assembly scaffold protein SufB